MPTTCWGVTRRHWLGPQRFEEAPRQAAFDDYLHALDLVDARIAMLERGIAALAADPAFAELVGRLRCLRGIDTLTALGIAAEVGDFSRFASAEEFMSFVGLVPSERSSGERRRQGSITKTGNAHIRRLLVEAAWSAGRRPQVGERLARRQHGQDPLLRAPPRRCPKRPPPRRPLQPPPPPPRARGARPRQAAPKDRRRLRPRAGRLRLGDRHRAAAPRRGLSDESLRQEQRNAPDHTEDPRFFYAAPARAGDPRL